MISEDNKTIKVDNSIVNLKLKENAHVKYLCLY